MGFFGVHRVRLVLLCVSVAVGAVLPASASAAATGTITYPGVVTNAPAASISFTSTGATSTQLERASAPLMAGTCGGLGPWSPMGPVNPTSPYMDTTTLSDSCYQYRLRLTDSLGATTYAMSPNSMKIDRTAPFGTINGAPVSPFSNTITLTGTASDAATYANVQLTYSGPMSGNVCLNPAISSSSWSCSWNTTTLPDGTYTLSLAVQDAAGNTNSSTRTVTIDNSPPMATLASIIEGTNPAYQHVSGSTVFVNPIMSGSFMVNVNATDAGTGIDNVTFPSLGASWTPGGMSDSVSPYSATYTWTSGAGAPGTVSALAFDFAGLTASAPFTVVADTAPPSGASLTVSGTTVANLSFTGGTDAGSGVATRQLQRRSAPDAGGVCGSFGPWSNLGPANPTSPYTDTTVAPGSCYGYQLQVTDNVGNVTTATTPTQVQPGGGGTPPADTTQPSVTIAGSPVVGSGIVTLSGTSADSGSGVAYVNVAASGPASSTVCTVTSPGALPSWSCAWNTTALPDGTYTITATATDAAANTATTTRTLVVDNTQPSANVLGVTEQASPQWQHSTASVVFVNPAQSGSFTVNVATTDAGTGVQQVAFTMPGAGWTGSSPDTSAPFSSTITWGPGAVGGDIGIVASDAAGNTRALSLHVMLDAAPPTGGALAAAWIAGAASVQLTFTAGSDATSGVASTKLERRYAPRAAGVCGAFGPWMSIGATNPVSPFVDAAVTSSACFEYRLMVTDNVGNVSIYTAPGVSAPEAPAPPPAPPTTPTPPTPPADTTAPNGSIAPFTGPARGTVTITGTSDLGAGDSLSLRFAGPASGDICSSPASASGAWSCTWDTTVVPNGSYVLSARLVDAAGNMREITMTVDVANTTLAGGGPEPTTPAPNPVTPAPADPDPGTDPAGDDPSTDADPEVTAPTVPHVAWTPSVSVRWSGSDDGGEPSYELQRRSAGVRGGWTAWQSVSADAASPRTVKLAPTAVTTCLRVIATDDAGNATTSEESCTNAPIDDRELDHSAAWKDAASSAAHGRTLRTASAKGATLSTTIGASHSLELIAATCPTCGSVKVYSGSRLLGTVSLKSSKVLPRRTLPVPGAPGAGLLRIVVASATGPVRIDGIVLER